MRNRGAPCYIFRAIVTHPVSSMTATLVNLQVPSGHLQRPQYAEPPHARAMRDAGGLRPRDRRSRGKTPRFEETRGVRYCIFEYCIFELFKIFSFCVCVLKNTY